MNNKEFQLSKNDVLFGTIKFEHSSFVRPENEWKIRHNSNRLMKSEMNYTTARANNVASCWCPFCFRILFEQNPISLVVPKHRNAAQFAKSRRDIKLSGSLEFFFVV